MAAFVQRRVGSCRLSASAFAFCMATNRYFTLWWQVQAECPSSASDKNAEITFQQLNLNAPILEALEGAGYKVATPIQARAIPPLLEGRDVLGQAQTGTGKTAAFAVPMLQKIDVEQKVTQVVVLTPTRELAIQVAAAFRRYAGGMPGLRVAAIYGGQDYQVQFRQLDRGAHVVVGTPGRIIDHMRRGSLKLDDVHGLVLDEADEMLRMGFAEEVDWILTQTPAERQTALFSATMPDAIRRIAQRHLRNPAEITIKQRSATADTVRQRFVIALPHEKQEVLARVLEAESIDGVLIFVNTKSTTEPLAEFLSAQGHRTAALSSDVAQSQRERIVQNLRSGKVDVIIATDVAARGLDVQRISHVINYDFPTDSESYVHRIGRTGRAGRDGQRGPLSAPARAAPAATDRAGDPADDRTDGSSHERNHQRAACDPLSRADHGGHGAPRPGDVCLARGAIPKENDVPMDQIAAALAALATGDTPLLLTGERAADQSRRHRRRSRQLAAATEGAIVRNRETQRANRAGPSAGRPLDITPSRWRPFASRSGRAHKVKPTNIVGAIANETGLKSRCIGKIEIFDEHSTVDMLVGMPDRVFDTLKQVKIGGRRLNISRLADGSSPDDWPVVETARAAAFDAKPEARSVALPKEAEAPALPDRPVAKKPKVKSKAKFAATKSKLKRAGRKRILSSR